MFFKGNNSYIRVLILMISLGAGSMYAAASSSSSSSASSSRLTEQLTKRLYETIISRGDISKIVTLCAQQKIEIPNLSYKITLNEQECSLSALEVAAIYGAKDALKRLLNLLPILENNEVEKKQQEIVLAHILFSAVNYGLSNLETIKYLIEEEGANRYITHPFSRSSLVMLALEQNYPDEVIFYLLWMGIDPDSRNAQNQSAFTIAKQKKRNSVLTFFSAFAETKKLMAALSKLPDTRESAATLEESASIIAPALRTGLSDADRKSKEETETKSAAEYADFPSARRSRFIPKAVSSRMRLQEEHTRRAEQKEADYRATMDTLVDGVVATALSQAKRDLIKDRLQALKKQKERQRKAEHADVPWARRSSFTPKAMSSGMGLQAERQRRAEQKERKQKEAEIREIREKNTRDERKLRNLRSAELSWAATRKAAMDARVDGLVNNALSQASIELGQERSQALKAEQEKAAQEERKRKAEHTAREKEKMEREREREDAAERKSARASVTSEQSTEERKKTPAALGAPSRTQPQMEARASANTLVKDVALSLRLMAPHFIRTYGAFTPEHQQHVREQVTKKWLYKAVLVGDVDEFNGIMATIPGASVDFDNEDGISLLKCAINKENPAMIHAILEHVDAESYWEHNNSRSLFMLAQSKGNKAIMDVFDEHKKTSDLWKTYEEEAKKPLPS